MEYEYEITSKCVTRKATPGKFYLDSDGDLFLYMGGDDSDYTSDNTWLQVNRDGAFNRNSDYPSSPLTELQRDDLARVISDKLKDY